MAKVKVKKNDQVLVLSGKDAGVRSKVLRVFPAKGTAIVERVNLVKKHTRPNPQRQVQGGVLEREAPIGLPKLMVAKENDRWIYFFSDVRWAAVVHTIVVGHPAVQETYDRRFELSSRAVL